MNTPWTDELCRRATEATEATRLRTALGCLTTVLSVYPEHEKALSMAGGLLYYGMGRTRNQNAAEPLTLGDLLDPRLDRLFCSCEWPGCGNDWISAGTAFDRAEISVSNPRGGRCPACGTYSCRNHYAVDERERAAICPRCGVVLDCAPPANGRASRQTERLNQPVVHAVLLREGPLPPSRDFIRTVLEVQAPDVLEDGASLRVFHVPQWPDDPTGLASALVARDRPDYLGGDFELRAATGYERDGARWALVKIFKKTPKHTDPTVPTVS